MCEGNSLQHYFQQMNRINDWQEIVHNLRAKYQSETCISIIEEGLVNIKITYFERNNKTGAQEPKEIANGIELVVPQCPNFRYDE